MEGIGLQFGLINSLGRFAGDSPLMTLMLYALLPMLLAHLPNRTTLAALVSRFYERNDTSHCVRTITYKAGDNMNTQSGHGASCQEIEETSTERNNILQKAVRLYINKDQDKLDIRDAELYMLQSRHMPEGTRRSRTKKMGSTDDASLKKLMGYQIAKGPKANKWVLVDPDRQIDFRYFASERPMEDPIADTFSGKGAGKGAPTPRGVTTTFQLRCCAPDAQKAVDNFVEEALEYYKSLRAATIDTSRYFFVPRAASPFDGDYYGKGFGKGSASGKSYKKYVLSEHKTFESLFFPDKADVIRLLDDFAHAKGKFSTPGFPNKLGILLHGPPGTGKTSLIKSIAQYMKRHIVEVPLTKVKTNQDLFDSMFDLVFPVPGEDEAIQMDFKDIIFVLEDVDAASDFVQNRAPCESSSEGSDTSQQKTAILSSMNGKGKGKGSVVGSEHVHSKRNGKGGGCGAEECGEKQADDDVLNLAGLLNVLDGVVDSPGRIVIMTTNHPEKLDPALIRPGRVNLSLELGYMKSHEMVQIIEHIMRTELSPAHHVLAVDIAGRQCLTAAMVEQSCGETDSLDKLFEKLNLLASCNARDIFDARHTSRISSPPSSASTYMDVHSSSGSSHSSTSRSPSPE